MRVASGHLLTLAAGGNLVPPCADPWFVTNLVTEARK